MKVSGANEVSATQLGLSWAKASGGRTSHLLETMRYLAPLDLGVLGSGCRFSAAICHLADVDALACPQEPRIYSTNRTVARASDAPVPL